MKKIVSLALAGLMSLSLFAIGASAAEAENVVGGTTGVVDADWPDSPSKDSDINVKVETVVHKYAVDLTFDFSDLSVGNIVWDAENMKYTSDKTFANAEQTVTITNRSDLSVWAKVEVADTENDFVTVGVAADETSAKFNDFAEILKATAANGTDRKGKATEAPVKIQLTGETWEQFVEYYGAKFVAENKTFYKLATVTVSLKKSAN